MVLQLCGRVCRRLSFENPSLKKLGFLFLLDDVFGASPRFVAFASPVRAEALGSFRNPVLTNGVFCFKTNSKYQEVSINKVHYLFLNVELWTTNFEIVLPRWRFAWGMERKSFCEAWAKDWSRQPDGVWTIVRYDNSWWRRHAIKKVLLLQTLLIGVTLL